MRHFLPLLFCVGGVISSDTITTNGHFTEEDHCIECLSKDGDFHCLHRSALHDDDNKCVASSECQLSNKDTHRDCLVLLPEMEPFTDYPHPEEPPPYVADAAATDQQSCMGGLVTSDAQLALYQGCEHIAGGLTLQSHAITSLTSLQGVSGCLSHLFIDDTNLVTLSGVDQITCLDGLVVQNNRLLQDDVALKNLVGRIAGGVGYHNNQKLTSVGALYGVAELGRNSVGVSLQLSNNPLLAQVSTDNIVAMQGGMVFASLPQLTVVQFPELNSLGTDNLGISLKVSQVTFAQFTADKIQTVGGSIEMRESNILPLQYLVDNDVAIGSNVNDISVDIRQATDLTILHLASTSGGWRVFHNNQLASILGADGVTIGKDSNDVSLLVDGNAHLKNLTYSSNLAGGIGITRNSELEFIDYSGQSSCGQVEVTLNNALMQVHLGCSECQGLTVKENPHLRVIESDFTVNTGNLIIENDPALEILNTKLVDIDGDIEITHCNLLKNITGLIGMLENRNEGTKTLFDTTIAKELVPTEYLHDVSCTDGYTTVPCEHVVPNFADGVEKPNARLCGGTQKGWQSWSHWGSSGLYMDIDTSECNFDTSETPKYVSSISADSAHWQLVGVNSIYAATHNSFRVYVWHPVLRGKFLQYFAHRYNWQMNWMADTGKTSGVSDGAWNICDENEPNCIQSTVQLGASFTQVPAIVASLHGTKGHWKARGVHNIYAPSTTEFTIKIELSDPQPDPVQYANSNDWKVSYIANQGFGWDEEGNGDDSYFLHWASGKSTVDWNGYCDEDDCAAPKTLYMDTKTPYFATNNVAVVTSLVIPSDEQQQTWADLGGRPIGAGSTFRLTGRGFRTYLERTLGVLSVRQAGWEMNYIGMEISSTKPVVDSEDCTLQGCRFCGPNDRCLDCLDGYFMRYDTGTCVVSEDSSVDCQVSRTVSEGECTSPSGKVLQSCGQHGTKQLTYGIDELTDPTKAATACVASASLGISAAGTWACDSTSCTRTIECFTWTCPVNCNVGQWSSWSECSRSCGQGVKVRRRTVNADAGSHAHTSCPPESESLLCFDGNCPVDCELSTWTSWSECSLECRDTLGADVAGEKTRTRTIVLTPKYEGAPCNHRAETASCKDTPCAIHCEVSSWSNWGACSLSCNTGEQSRSRSIITEPDHGGNDLHCQTLNDTQDCNDFDCPIDCDVGAWQPWEECARTCTEGDDTTTHTRRRDITQPTLGGEGCPHETETAICNNYPCPRDCAWGSWTNWNDCPTSCTPKGHSSSQQTRTRAVDTTGAFGGKVCANSGSDSQACNAHACPVDCIYTAWGDWSHAVGDGDDSGKHFLKRVRQVQSPASDGGQDCTDFEQTKVPYCDENGHNDEVCAWSPCTRENGSGHKYRWVRRKVCSKGTSAITYNVKFRQGKICNDDDHTASYGNPNAHQQVDVPDCFSS